MALPTTLTLLAAMALPQEPGGSTKDTFRHAGLMPADAVLVLELKPQTEFRAELEQTRFWASLQ